MSYGLRRSFGRICRLEEERSNLHVKLRNRLETNDYVAYLPESPNDTLVVMNKKALVMMIAEPTSIIESNRERLRI